MKFYQQQGDFGWGVLFAFPIISYLHESTFVSSETCLVEAYTCVGPNPHVGVPNLGSHCLQTLLFLLLLLPVIVLPSVNWVLSNCVTMYMCRPR